MDNSDGSHAGIFPQQRESPSAMRGPVSESYRALVAAGRLEADAAQVAVVEELDALMARLDGYSPGAGPIRSGVSWA